MRDSQTLDLPRRAVCVTQAVTRDLKTNTHDHPVWCVSPHPSRVIGKRALVLPGSKKSLFQGPANTWDRKQRKHQPCPGPVARDALWRSWPSISCLVPLPNDKLVCQPFLPALTSSTPQSRRQGQETSTGPTWWRPHSATTPGAGTSSRRIPNGSGSKCSDSRP